MIRLIQDNKTSMYYYSCPFCSAELGFYLWYPPVYCDRCSEILPMNPASLIEFVESRQEYYGDPDAMEYSECF